MIAANVAAAKALEAKKSPVMYRVHEVPGREKLVALKDYLATFKVKEEGADSTWVEWSGVFTPDGVTDGEVEELFKGIYEGGLEALKANF